ncbi:MAG: TraR/DksA family transcriptional regulator [Castellaniella sp.]
MNTPAQPLTDAQRRQLAARIAERKELLLGEIRQVSHRSQHDLDVDQISRSGQIGHAAAIALRQGIAEAEILRDIEEVRDIVAAEQRLESSQYGECIDCGRNIRFARLDAYPTAKRCYQCQVEHEQRRVA